MKNKGAILNYGTSGSRVQETQLFFVLYKYRYRRSQCIQYHKRMQRVFEELYLLQINP
jgi:hypothetical protein